MFEYKAIVARSSNGCIGAEGKIPWKLSEDLKFFKRMTHGNIVIMGRRTWESLGRCLTNRTNIVVSPQMCDNYGVGTLYSWKRNASLSVCCSIASSIETADQTIAETNYPYDPTPKVFFIGGSRIYEEALEKNLIGEFYVTQLKDAYDGDTYFSLPHNWVLKETLEENDQFSIQKWVPPDKISK